MGSNWRRNYMVSRQVEENLDKIHALFGSSMDLVIREFQLANGQKAAAFYIDGLVDNDILGRDFFSPLMKTTKNSSTYTCDEIAKSVLMMGEFTIYSSLDDVIAAVLQGLTALFVAGDNHAICAQAINWPQRSVEEPATDVVLRGPREGFIESMRINVSLLRRKIHHPDFKVETVCLGRYSQTDIALVYVDSIVNEDVLRQIKKRLKKIDIDSILDSGYIEQLIQDTPYSLFPTIGVAEKPDIAAARILEGRVAVLIDGSPIALTIPMLFIEGLHSPEDYYTRFFYASWVRIIRVIAFLISIYLPGFFLAAACYHQQIIPFKLLLSMAAAESQTPFSTGFSLLLIGLSYEILREAGIRLPKPAGQAISIVGAIVMGDAAVNANLISAPVLIVLAITVVASFVTVAYVDASTILRLLFLLLGWQFGLFGLLLGTMVMLIYLCSLESFGVPFMSPLSVFTHVEDSIIRMPLWMMKLRPAVLSRNLRRMSKETKPPHQRGDKE